MFTLECDIRIGNYKFTQVNSVEIESSWRQIADTAKIKIPNLKASLEKVFKEGDPVSISLGYKDQYFGEEFTGFISQVKPNIPFEIHCEDYIYFLKRVNLKKSWREVTLTDLIKYVVDQTNSVHNTSIALHSQIPDITFNKFRLNNVNGAKTLETLKDEYGLTAYFRGSVLYVGLAYAETVGNVDYSLSWNVIDSDLEFRRSDQMSIKIKAIGIKKDNTKIEEVVGDPDGDQRTLYFYNIDQHENLRVLAEEELNKQKFDGLEGSFKTFLIPFAMHGQTAVLRDPNYDEGRAGSYIIDSVKTTFNTTSGAKRNIELGINISA